MSVHGCVHTWGIDQAVSHTKVGCPLGSGINPGRCVCVLKAGFGCKLHYMGIFVQSDPVIADSNICPNPEYACVKVTTSVSGLEESEDGQT